MNNAREAELLIIIREQPQVIERLRAEIAEWKAQLGKHSSAAQRRSTPPSPRR